MSRAAALMVILIQCALTGPALADGTDDQAACAATAFRNYLEENQVFKDHHGMDDQIAQRRLQERFCSRLAQCMAIHKGQSADAAKASDFADCLKEEAIELYRLYKD